MKKKKYLKLGIIHEWRHAHFETCWPLDPDGILSNCLLRALRKTVTKVSLTEIQHSLERVVNPKRRCKSTLLSVIRLYLDSTLLSLLPFPCSWRVILSPTEKCLMKRIPRGKKRIAMRTWTQSQSSVPCKLEMVVCPNSTPVPCSSPKYQIQRVNSFASKCLMSFHDTFGGHIGCCTIITAWLLSCICTGWKVMKELRPPIPSPTLLETFL